MLHTQSIPHKTKGSSAVKAKEFCTKERKKMKKKRKKKSSTTLTEEPWG